MKFQKLFSVIYWIFLGFIVLIALLLIFSVFPIPGNFKVFVVQSGSMAPAIKMGSIVIVKPAQDYKIGDIITFGPYSKTRPPTTHRIYEIKVEGGNPIYITKGDANNSPDSREITKRDIVGKVIFSIPYLGYFLAFAKRPLGFFLLIIVPALIIISDEIKNIIKELKKTQNQCQKV